MNNELKKELLDDMSDPTRVLVGCPLGTAQEERELVKHWIREAATQLRNAERTMHALQEVHEVSTIDRIVMAFEGLMNAGNMDDVDMFLTPQNAIILPLDGITCIIVATIAVKEQLKNREKFINVACERFKTEYPQIVEIYGEMR
jgi:hypothetical protein